MSDYNERLAHVVQELASLQRDLNQLLMDDAAAAGPTFEFAEKVDAGALRDLKSVVDQMRHFLWFYLQAVSGGSEAGERTMQLLRQISCNSAAIAKADPATFLERLNALADFALADHTSNPARKPN